MADFTPYEDKKKIPIGMLVRRGGGLDPFGRQAEDKIRIGILVRQGGGADPLSGQPEGKFTITIKIIEGGVAGLILHENKA